MTSYTKAACVVLLSVATLGARCGEAPPEDDPDAPTDSVIVAPETIDDVEADVEV